MRKNVDELVASAGRVLARARCTLAFTGAGISVPSGIPDFRSPGGLWSRLDPLEVASTWALEHNPKGVWEFLLEAAAMFASAAPNPAHTALAELEAAGALDTLVTQNIDGLHQRAGSVNVVEFHGDMAAFFCNACGTEYSPVFAASLTRESIPWLCGACGGLIRPRVVFFGESIPGEAMRKAFDAAERADVALVVGTSGEVAPASMLPGIVKRRGGTVIEVNLGPTNFTDITDIRIDAPAETVLPAITAAMIAERARA